ncbi:MAG TPA: hypothetical protein DHN33_09715, partial [Eubacteriaceae bacterium]|nr:hypothetical protein [Eubacteriaceae bacterium]
MILNPFSGASQSEYKDAASLAPYGKDIVETDRYGTIVPDQLVVVLSEEHADEAESMVEEVGGTITGYLDLIHLMQITMPGKNLEENSRVLEDWKTDERIELAFFNVPIEEYAQEGEPCIEQVPFRGSGIYANKKIQKGYELIGAQKMMDIVRRSKVELHPVHLGIADEGINVDASDLAGLEIEGDTYNGYTWMPGDNGSYKFAHQSHGTKILQQIAGSDDGEGVAGLASIIGDQLKVTSKNVLNYEVRQMLYKDAEMKERLDEAKPSWNGLTEEEENEEFNASDEKWKKIVEEKRKLSEEEQSEYDRLKREKEKLEEEIRTVHRPKVDDLFGQLKKEVTETPFGASSRILDGQEELEAEIDEAESALYKVQDEVNALVEQMKVYEEHPTMVQSLVHLNRLVQSGATVINASYGAVGSSVDKNVAKAYNKYLNTVAEKNPKIIFIAAAGNDGKQL